MYSLLKRYAELELARQVDRDIARTIQRFHQDRVDRETLASRRGVRMVKVLCLRG